MSNLGFAITSNLSSCLETLEIGQITKMTVHKKCLMNRARESEGVRLNDRCKIFFFQLSGCASSSGGVHTDAHGIKYTARARALVPRVYSTRRDIYVTCMQRSACMQCSERDVNAFLVFGKNGWTALALLVYKVSIKTSSLLK